MKRFLIIMLALFMCLACFASCDKDNETADGNGEYVQVSDSEWEERTKNIIPEGTKTYTAAMSCEMLNPPEQYLTDGKIDDWSQMDSKIYVDVENQIVIEDEVFETYNTGSNCVEKDINKTYTFFYKDAYWHVAEYDSEYDVESYLDYQYEIKLRRAEGVEGLLEISCEMLAGMKSMLQYDEQVGGYVMDSNGTKIDLRFHRDGGVSYFSEMPENAYLPGTRSAQRIYDINTTKVEIPEAVYKAVDDYIAKYGN